MMMVKDKKQPNQQPKGQMGSDVTQLSILQQCKQMKRSSLPAVTKVTQNTETAEV